MNDDRHGGGPFNEWDLREPREQSDLPSEPYDRWVSPDGVCMAEFHRRGEGFLLRFPDQADFALDPNGQGDGFRGTGWPIPGCPSRVVRNLLTNAVLPVLGNHAGGLFLHGSAVSIHDGTGRSVGAAAFLGLSRGGKTTLAGALAKQGHPFLTEDVIDLRRRDGTYWLQPKTSKLRLFADSARHLLGTGPELSDNDEKQDVEGGSTLPFASEPVPLKRIYVLGTDHAAPLEIASFPPPAALVALLPHAFILDVEDKPRLRAHFSRMADLIDSVECHALDYPRDYAELPRVTEAILASFRAD